eukprot:g1569.t1
MVLDLSGKESNDESISIEDLFRSMPHFIGRVLEEDEKAEVAKAFPFDSISEEQFSTVMGLYCADEDANASSENESDDTFIPESNVEFFESENELVANLREKLRLSSQNLRNEVSRCKLLQHEKERAESMVHEAREEVISLKRRLLMLDRDLGNERSVSLKLQQELAEERNRSKGLFIRIGELENKKKSVILPIETGLSLKKVEESLSDGNSGKKVVIDVENNRKIEELKENFIELRNREHQQQLQVKNRLQLEVLDLKEQLLESKNLLVEAQKRLRERAAEPSFSGERMSSILSFASSNESTGKGDEMSELTASKVIVESTSSSSAEQKSPKVLKEAFTRAVQSILLLAEHSRGGALSATLQPEELSRLAVQLRNLVIERLADGEPIFRVASEVRTMVTDFGFDGQAAQDVEALLYTSLQREDSDKQIEETDNKSSLVRKNNPERMTVQEARTFGIKVDNSSGKISSDRESNQFSPVGMDSNSPAICQAHTMLKDGKISKDEFAELCEKDRKFRLRETVSAVAMRQLETKAISAADFTQIVRSHNSIRDSLSPQLRFSKTIKKLNSFSSVSQTHDIATEMLCEALEKKRSLVSRRIKGMVSRQTQRSPIGGVASDISKIGIINEMQQHQLQALFELKQFLDLTIGEVNDFKGDYLNLRGDSSVKEILIRAGAKPHETIFFSSVVQRVVPPSFFSSGRLQRSIIVTEAAVYECIASRSTLWGSATKWKSSIKTPIKGVPNSLSINETSNAIRTPQQKTPLPMQQSTPLSEPSLLIGKCVDRVPLEKIGCLSLSRLMSSSIFAIVVPTRFDRLYDSVRRNELVAWMLHLYESRTGQALITNHMRSILLTLESGEVMTTYFSDADGSIRMELYNK